MHLQAMKKLALAAAVFLSGPAPAAADAVGWCDDGSFPGSYVELGSERLWCAQEGLWNMIPLTLALLHPMNSWIPIVFGLLCVGIGGLLTGSSATISGWVVGGRLVGATYHPAVQGSSSLLLRLLGGLLVIVGFGIFLIGVTFAIVKTWS